MFTQWIYLVNKGDGIAITLLRCLNYLVIPIILFYFLFFVFGSFVGSFLNLVSDRLVKGETIVSGRSVCDFCRKPLSPKNLLPFLSYLLQGGKSSCCKNKLSWYYPISEFLTGVAFMFAAHYSRIFVNTSVMNVVALIYFLIVLSFFVVLFLTDAKFHLLPDKIVYPAIFLSVFFVLLLAFLDLKIYRDALISTSFGPYLIEAGIWHNQVITVMKQLAIMLASSFLIALFFIMLILVTKGRGMGGGDIKLGFLIGVFNGFPGNVLAVFLGFLLGSIYSLVLIALNRKNMKDTIAFGPFLILGSLVSFVWSQQILVWYFGLF